MDAGLELTGFPIMSLSELRERIKLAIENSECIIEYDRRNGFAWWEQDFLHCSPGVAVAIVGNEPFTSDFTDRGYRAQVLGWEWSYLMHFEQAINALFQGDIRAYNFTGYFPKISQWSYIPPVTEEKYWHYVYKALKD